MTDVRIKRMIFNDCTSNGDFEFSVDLTNIYSEETNGAHAHNRDRFPLKEVLNLVQVCKRPRGTINFCQKRYSKGVPFLSKMVRGWTSGWSLPM